MSRLATTTLRIGDPAPPFSLPTLDGEHFQLGNLLESGVGLLVFVPGSWSPGARRLVSELNSLHTDLLDAGVTLAAVFTQDASSLRRRLETRPPFPVLIDQERNVVRDFGVYRAVSWDGIGITRPAAFIVDHEGAIRFLYVGERDSDIPDGAALLRLGSWLRGDIPLPERPTEDAEDEELLDSIDATQAVPVVAGISEPSPEPDAAFDEDVADAGGETETPSEPETHGETSEQAGDPGRVAAPGAESNSTASDADPIASTADLASAPEASAPEASAPEATNGSSAADAAGTSEAVDPAVTDAEAAPELPKARDPDQNGASTHPGSGEIRRPTVTGNPTDR